MRALVVQAVALHLINLSHRARRRARQTGACAQGSQPRFTVRGVAAPRARAAAELFSRQIPTTKPARQQAAGHRETGNLQSDRFGAQSPIYGCPGRPILSCLLPGEPPPAAGSVGRRARGLASASCSHPAGHALFATLGRHLRATKKIFWKSSLNIHTSRCLFGPASGAQKNGVTLLYYTAKRVEQLPRTSGRVPAAEQIQTARGARTGGLSEDI